MMLGNHSTPYLTGYSLPNVSVSSTQQGLGSNTTNLFFTNDVSPFQPIVQHLGLTYVIIYVTLGILIASGIICSNSFPLIALYKAPDLRTKTGIILGAMSFADGLSGIPLLLTSQYVRIFKHSLNACRIAFFSSGFITYSVLLQVMLSADRLYSVMLPFKYWEMKETKRYTWVIGGITCLILVNSITMVADISKENWEANGRCTFGYTVTHYGVYLACIHLQLVVSGFLLIVCNIAIAAMAWCNLKKRLAMPSLNASKKRRLIAEHRVTKACLMVVGIHLMCYAPVLITAPFYTSAASDPGSTRHVTMRMVYDYVVLFMYVNNLLNPWIYCTKLKGFRRMYRSLFCTRSTPVRRIHGRLQESLML